MRISWLIDETQHRMEVPDCELAVEHEREWRIIKPSRGIAWMLALPPQARLWIEYADGVSRIA